MAFEKIICGHQGCTGFLQWVRDDYGSVGGGGSCEVYKCLECKKTYHFQLPD